MKELFKIPFTMYRNKIKNIAIAFIFILLVSCRNEPRTYLPNISGRAGEVLVVMDNAIWNSAIGDTFRHTLAKSIIYFPQPEPVFDIIHVSNNGFSNMFKLHRNIIFCDVSPNNQQAKLTYQTDKWGKYQLIINMYASDEQSLLSLFLDKKDKIISNILAKERDRIILNHKRVEEIGIREKLEKNHKVSLIVPKGYSLDVDSSDFVWISHKESEMDQGILIYHFPYLEEDIFLKDNLIQKRDEYLKRYVKGAAKGSYMKTENQFPVLVDRYYDKNGQYITKLHGLWELENDFMGGPFVSVSTVDTLRNRVVIVDGYVFAPNKDKRNYIRQTEAILHTLKIVK